jgi:hypothetical protein
MINNTTYNLPFPIRTVVKWEVLRVTDCDNLTPPYVGIEIQLYSTNSVKWPTPYTLVIRDSGYSRVMRVNASSTNFSDQILMTDVQLSGTPYTSISAAYDANTANGTKAQRRKAVEDLLVSLGAMPTEFATT